jgi:lipopolysaccharide/colanic/teichoic acid biosynthesis glycosyltransferase
MKRLIDIIGSAIGLILLAPLAPFIALAIKLDSFFSLSLRAPKGRGNPVNHERLLRRRLLAMTNSPVFIKLNRVSKGKIIKVYKFRSMVVDAEKQKKELLKLNERKDGPFFKIKNDPRITKVGRFLRKTRIDEFPQLINVLKGELSLVGPRPHEPEELYAYPKEYRILLSAKTGLTGLSQVNGASSLPFLKELEYDKYYLENQSLWLDLKILFKTLIIFLTDPTGV